MATGTHASPTFIADLREGTVAGPGGSVRLEPKVMAVLQVLSEYAGRVVPRDELLDRVWPGVIVTEHTLSRCIYELRRDLGRIGTGREAKSYNPIETLPKRGYRLLSAVDFRSGNLSQGMPDYAPAGPRIPFVVGQWVRGARFYGRSSQIDDILAGPRNCIWLLGTRRIGKTSLLKQIELVASTQTEQRYFPVFWDFQGVDTAEELHLNFADALLDAEERLEASGIRPADVEADDLFVSLERLRRRLRSRNLKLLLLCDEVEELIRLQKNEPSILRKLRHSMQSREGIRTVLASTIRLWALAEQRDDTSPFLHGFAPPLYVERLTDADACALIGQSQLGPAERPQIDDDTVRMIREHCDNHPYLVQLVCKRYVESRDLEEAIEQVGTDRMVSYFFSVDFEMLPGPEQQVVRLLAQGNGAGDGAIRSAIALGDDECQGTLRRLESLSFIRRSGDRYVLGNYFFRRWLREMSAVEAEPIAIRPAIAGPVIADVTRHWSASGLFAELKQRNVFRVGFAYILVAWVLLQAAEIVFGFLELPAWMGKLFLVLLSLGLPVALLLAWAFQLTSGGLKRDRGLEQPVSDRAPRRRAGIVMITILVIVAALLAIYRYS